VSRSAPLPPTYNVSKIDLIYFKINKNPECPGPLCSITSLTNK
jgi:hypothetical protein